MSVILLTCAIVLALMCASYIILEYITFRQSVRANVATLANVVASNSSAALAFNDKEDALDVLNAFDAEENIVIAALYDLEGNLFAKYPADTNDEVFPDMRDTPYYWFQDKHLMGFEEVSQKGEKQGMLYLQSDLKSLYRQLGIYALIGLSLIAVSMLVAFLLSRFLQRMISTPILLLEQTAKVVSKEHDYSVRALKIGNDEVGSLTDAFNVMLSQIQRQNEEILSFNQKLEQKVNERTLELKQQKEFVETIINSSVDPIAVFDRNLNYIMVNKRLSDFYEMPNEDLVGKNLIEVFPLVKKYSMSRDLERALAGESVHNPKYKSPVLNLTFENFYIPLKDQSDQVYGVLMLEHDITNIVEANEKLEKVNSELLKSNRDLEQFAYVASHDLQEPLRKIQTFTQLLGENMDDVHLTKKYQEKINQSSVRMKQLIQDMLNFSRISNSEDAFEDTDLNIILENLIIDFELLLREKEAKINHPNLPTIKGIPLQLSQLFANIINNSLKYTEEKPVIDITCRMLDREDVASYPKLNPDATYYQIDFSDNGIGFDPQYSEQIFAIFQRLHGKQSYSGTGIGLALCKKIVENHKGLIFAKGEPDKGATFTIILPVA